MWGHKKKFFAFFPGTCQYPFVRASNMRLLATVPSRGLSLRMAMQLLGSWYKTIQWCSKPLGLGTNTTGHLLSTNWWFNHLQSWTSFSTSCHYFWGRGQKGQFTTMPFQWDALPNASAQALRKSAKMFCIGLPGSLDKVSSNEGRFFSAQFSISPSNKGAKRSSVHATIASLDWGLFIY